MTTQKDIFELIRLERISQDIRFGKQQHSPLFWLAILTEEVGEVATELQDAAVDKYRLRAELVQCAAVAVAWLEAMDAEKAD